VSRRKLSPKDFKALNRATIGVRYPPGGGPAELRMFGAKERGYQRKKPAEGGFAHVRARARKAQRASPYYPSKITNVEPYIPTTAGVART
jgi:hypothetical protein